MFKGKKEKKGRLLSKSIFSSRTINQIIVNFDFVQNEQSVIDHHCSG